MTTEATEPQQDVDPASDAQSYLDANPLERLGEPSEEAPAPEKPAETTEATPETPSEPAKKTKLDELRERAKAERERRSQAEQEQSKQSEADKLRAELEQERKQLREAVAGFQRDPVAYLKQAGLDPLEAFDRIQRVALDEKGAKTTDELTSLRAELKEMREEWRKEREDRAVQTKMERAQQTTEQARQAFVRFTEDGQRFPLAAKLSPERRLREGVRIAQQLQAEGVPFSSVDEERDAVAHLLEDELAELRSVLSSESPGDGTREANEGSATGSRRGQPGKTLTKAMASETAATGTRDKTEDELHAEVEKYAEDFFAARRAQQH